MVLRSDSRSESRRLPHRVPLAKQNRRKICNPSVRIRVRISEESTCRLMVSRKSSGRAPAFETSEDRDEKDENSVLVKQGGSEDSTTSVLGRVSHSPQASHWHRASGRGFALASGSVHANPIGRSAAGIAPGPRRLLGDRGIRNGRESPTRGKDRQSPSFTSEDGATSIEPTPSSPPTRPPPSARVRREAIQATSPRLTGRCLRGSWCSGVENVRGLSRKDPRRR